MKIHLSRMFRIGLLAAGALLFLAACEITEDPGNQGTVESVTVTPADPVIVVGGERQLDAEVTGTGDFSDSVTWSSSDESVATVSSSGLVAARAPGSSTITAASSQTASVTGSSTVTVIAAAAEACTDDATVINFADERVESAVRGLYGIDGAEITCSDVSQDFPSDTNEFGQEILNVLVLSSCEEGATMISSLEGLQHLSRLVRLELACNDLTDISTLSSMTSLEELNLDENDITNLTPLAGLVNLEVLGLYDNQVEDLAPLSGLQNLRILYLSDNRIRNLEPLAGLTLLEHLWLFRNCRGEGDTDCLVDIGPIAGLANLTALVAGFNEIRSLAPVASLTNLEFLDASANDIRDLGPLAGLGQLRTVLLYQNPISSLEALAGNTGFPAGEPYSFERAEVRLPTGGGAFEFHLQLGYDCLDTDDPVIIAQRDALVDRGTLIGGFGFMEEPRNPACTNASSYAPFRSWWQ
jgi:hypothetical protein